MPNPFLAAFENEPALLALGGESKFKAYLEKVDLLASVMESRDSASDRMEDDFWPEADSYLAAYRPYNVTADGILVIPVKGVLLNDFPYAYGSYATGYPYISRAVDRGMADGNVKAIAFAINSGGGAVADNFPLVDKIHGYRGQKPMRAFAAEHAYSAAYSIASAADTITVSSTGGVGSIGVVTSHLDMSKAMDQAGYKITFIHFGEHKVDGNPYEPLPAKVKAKIQSRIDALGKFFVAVVARNRAMSEKAVRETEAATFTAQEAVSNGLADNIGSLDDAMAAFAADLSKEDEQMNIKDMAAVDQAAIDTARNEGFAKGKEEGARDGMAAGITQERDRISAIMNSDAGKARPKAAAKMALNPKLAALDADAAIEMLAEMPEEKVEATTEVQKPEGSKPADTAGSEFNKAMDSSDNPNLGAPADKQTSKSEQRAAAALAMIGKSPKVAGK